MEIVSFVKIGTTLWGPAKLTRSAELHLQWASVPLVAGRLPLVASSRQSVPACQGNQALPAVLEFAC